MKTAVQQKSFHSRTPLFIKSEKILQIQLDRIVCHFSGLKPNKNAIKSNKIKNVNYSREKG